MKHLLNVMLVTAVFVAMAGCASTNGSIPFEGQTEIILENGDSKAEPTVAKTKGVAGYININNQRGEPARIYINGLDIGLIGPFSSASMYVGDGPFVRTMIEAYYRSGHYRYGYWDGNVGNAYFTIQ